MNKKKLLLAALLLTIVLTVYWLDLDRFLSLDYVRSQIDQLRRLVATHFFAASLVFFLLYAAVASMSIPGGALAFTLAAGALFGLAWGSVIVSFASTIGGTIACLLSRFLLREFVERHFPYAVERINEGIRRDGAYYLFGLRLVPLFPYFVINLAMGLTQMPLLKFYWVSQLGMLPATVIFVNAGTQLARISDPGDILSPSVVGALVLLGLLPLVTKKLSVAVMNWHRRHP